MALKAARTVYCSNFDLALFDAYTHTAIKEHLIHAKWNVNNVYIMNSKKSFKIEFKTTKEARKFIDSKNTSIGGIQLHQNTKEMEIDPTVPQCYVCGILHPTHNSNNCPGPKKCLKCNSRDHQFYDCLIPKDINRMSEEQKAQRYCIPCQSIGDHTSLDHRFCKTKRKFIEENIKTARENKKIEDATNKRDIELIKRTLEITTTDTWPALAHNFEHHQKISTVLLMALLDESQRPGIFQRKLDEGLNNNGLPNIQ